MQKKHLLGDGLFYLQMFCAIAVGIAQPWLMQSSTKGISITWLLFWGLFLLINLSLSYRAHQVLPSRVTKQTVIVYATWAVILMLNILVFLWQGATIWNEIDTLTAILAITGIVVTLVVARTKGLPAVDPLVRGYLAVSFKGLPQLTLAYNIWQYGGEGLSIVAVLVGHITVCSRLGQIFLSLREAGWDRNRQGSAISEIANEGSWIVVTIVWLIR